jgi:electron transfer flavoprotein alpha subunit
MDMSKILVVAEQRNNSIKDITFEVATLAGQLSSDVIGLVIGGSVDAEAAKFGEYGVSDVITVNDSNLENYSYDAYATIVKSVVESEGIDVVMMGASSLGKDLSAHVGAKINAGVAQDCIQINDDLSAVRPMYAGKVLTTVKINSDKKVFTLRANSVKAETKGGSASIRSITVETSNKGLVKELSTSSGEKIDVAEANIIISGGRGMGGPENWHLIENVAKKLHAATGASRAVVDAGWRPHAEQVGQTGKTVSPSLYIACGISGAIQHLAGMKTSKFIVAINKDPEAPIFKVADYGIVGDVMDVLPALEQAL